MANNKTLMIGLGVGLVVIVVGAVILIPHSSNAPSGDSSNSQKSSTDVKTADKSTAAATIKYNGSSFSPSPVSVKAGDAITIENDGSADVEFESDPHPVHTDNPELNVGEIAPGSSKTITVKKVGNWGYHNHLDSSQTGRIVIQ